MLFSHFSTTRHQGLSPSWLPSWSPSVWRLIEDSQLLIGVCVCPLQLTGDLSLSTHTNLRWQKLDDGFSGTVSLAVYVLLYHIDNDLCGISTDSETRTAQKQTAQTYFLNCCSGIFVFWKMNVWQWPNCGQYLCWCIVYSYFAHLFIPVSISKSVQVPCVSPDIILHYIWEYVFKCKVLLFFRQLKFNNMTTDVFLHQGHCNTLETLSWLHGSN